MTIQMKARKGVEPKKINKKPILSLSLYLELDP